MSTCLVTGGAGFIGSHLTELLVSQGWRVRVLDDLSTGRLHNLDAVLGNIEFTRGSVTDESAVDRAVAGVEVVFHLAAKVFVPESFKRPDEYEQVNVRGTKLLLDAAKKAGVRRVVFSSSCAIYGDTTDLPIAETATPKPTSPYAANKLAAEELGRLAATSEGPAFSALRYFNVYGSRQDPRSAYSGVMSRFAKALANNEATIIYGTGKQTRDFIHVSDVARANLCAAMGLEQNAVFNVGTGRETSIERVQELMSSIIGHHAKPIYRPARPGDIMRSMADVGLMARQLGFKAATPIEVGMRDLVAPASPS